MSTEPRENDGVEWSLSRPTVLLCNGSFFSTFLLYHDDTLDRKSHTSLRVYDVFCMLFLQRLGVYLLERLLYVSGRDAAPSAFSNCTEVVQSYVNYIKAKGRQHTLDRRTIINWWYFYDTARSLKYEHQDISKRVRSHVACYDPPEELKDNFFDALLDYLPLLTSGTVQLRKSPHLTPKNAYRALSYGVFAQSKLQLGQRLQTNPLRGHLVLLTTSQYELLPESSSFSIYEPSSGELKYNTTLEQMVNRDAIVISGDDETDDRQVARQPTTRSRQTLRRYVVLGGISLLNHACVAHANMFPCRFVDTDVNGYSQWQTVTTSEVVKIEPDDELYVTYGSGEVYPCPVCARSGRKGTAPRRRSQSNKKRSANEGQSKKRPAPKQGRQPRKRRA